MPAPTNGRIAWKVSAATLTVAALVLLGTCLAKVGQQRELARRRRRLSVKVSSPYARSALREAARHCGLTVEESASCIWADFSGHDWDRFLENLDDFQRVSCFYTRAGLVRKGMLAHYLDKRRRRLLKEGKSVAAVNVLPESLVVDLQDEDDLSALRRRLLNANTKSEKSDPPNHCLDGSNTNNNNNSNNININSSSSNNNSNNNTTTSLTSVSASSSSSSRVRKHPAWIAKASSSNRGENLFFSHDVDTLIEALRESSLRSENPVQEWVVQRYVAPPLLIGNRKFHIRAHFLVVGCPYTGMTRAWLHRRHHVLLASSVPYNGESQDRHVHLTNHRIQAKHPNYNEESQIFHFDSLRKLFHFKEGQGRGGGKALNLEKYLLERMSTALSEALAAAAAAPVAFAPLPQAFELFGADFTLEDRGSEPPSVWLLEVNAGPDLEVFGQRYRSECVDLLRSCMKLAVEPYLLEAAPALFRAPPTGAEAASAASRAGFYGEHCLWHAPAQQHSAKEVLDSFKKRIGIAGRWARALHDQSGVTVRGPQSAVVL